MFATPRPEPGRLIPAAGGALVLLLALPIFLVAGWRVEGWALGAVLWLAGEVMNLLLTRVRARGDSVAASGVQAFGLFFKAIALLVVLFAAVASDPQLALAAAATFALAYTFELGLSLVLYFGESA